MLVSIHPRVPKEAGGAAAESKRAFVIGRHSNGAPIQNHLPVCPLSRFENWVPRRDLRIRSERTSPGGIFLPRGVLGYAHRMAGWLPGTPQESHTSERGIGGKALWTLLIKFPFEFWDLARFLVPKRPILQCGFLAR